MLIIAFSSVTKLLKAWYEKERYSKELERKNLEAELQFLKAQINPHFLFNVLNSVYFSIGKKPDLAQEIVLQLSEILSHQLYNAPKQKVLLSKEIAYLEKYISLEKIRQDTTLHLDFVFPKNPDQMMISPMLLLPFVENAFKHGYRSSPLGYWIRIRASLTEKYFHFMIENSFHPDNLPGFENKGIGLENVQRRLALLYPERHQLVIRQYAHVLVSGHQAVEEEADPEHIFQVVLQLERTEL